MYYSACELNSVLITVDKAFVKNQLNNSASNQRKRERDEKKGPDTHGREPNAPKRRLVPVYNIHGQWNRNFSYKYTD